MKTKKIFQSTPLKVIFSFIVSSILVFLLYETLYLEKKIEKSMFEISTSDVLTISENNARYIKSLLKESDNYIADIKNDANLQKEIESKLKLLRTKNIKYAYLLYKDEKNTFRFLVDASNDDEKAFLNQKFDVDSQSWFDIYIDKKPVLIKHDLLKTLSITFIVPIIREDVELLLVIDFSLDKLENINDIIAMMQNGIITILVLLVSFLSILVVQMINYQKVKRSAYNDQLTQVYNRNYLEEYQDTFELEDYVLAIVDIDYFKKINDTYGHDVGDIILRQTAKIITDTIRISNNDLVIRYGGEEFIVLIKKTKENEKAIYGILERIRKNIENFMFAIEAKKDIKITVSIGVNLNPHNSLNFTEAFKIADTALYDAKESGRNNIKIL